MIEPHEFIMVAPYIIGLADGNEVLGKRIDIVDHVHLTEEEFMSSFARLDVDVVINSSILVKSSDISFIIKPLDNVLAHCESHDVNGAYIGIDPILCEYIVRDTSGVEHNALYIEPELIPEDTTAMQKVLALMRATIDGLKETAEITPDFKENLEGNLEEIYAVLDMEIGDETSDI